MDIYDNVTLTFKSNRALVLGILKVIKMREKKQRNIALVTSFEKRLIPLIVFVEIFGKKKIFSFK